MNRKIEEIEYVLKTLRQMRQEVIAHPEWFEPDALERIEKAVGSMREARGEAKAA